MIDVDYAGQARLFHKALQGLLEFAAGDPTITDIFINDDRVSVKGRGTTERFALAHFGLNRRAVQRAGAAAAVIGEVQFGSHGPQWPMMSVRVPPGMRVTYACPPAADRWQVSIRFLGSRDLTLEDYVAQGVMSAGQCAQLQEIIAERKTLLVSGGTGAGKTTLLRAILRECAGADRLLILEDIPELMLNGVDVVHLYTTRQVRLTHLLQHTLRMNPDRIIVGEVRGEEALELVRAMNTGHAGSMCTIHSDGAEMALHRLRTLVMEGQPNFHPDGITQAIDYVLQLTNAGGVRRLREIWPVKK